MPIDTWRLEPEKRLILAQVLHESAEAEGVAIVSAYGKNGSARPARLQRHDGPLLPCKRPGLKQIFQDLALASL